MAITIDDDDDFFVEEEDELEGSVYNVVIKVFGVGGGGGNSVEHMAKKFANGTEYVLVNTDVPTLRTKDKKLMRLMQIGRKTTKGQGAGGDPVKGAEAAREDSESIEKFLIGTSLVFISAGMGGGTGTGAAPIIAELARKKGILTVGVVTKPFAFEGADKMNQALKGIAEMRKHVDSLVIIPNEKLITLDEQKKMPVKQSFAMVDDVLCNVVSSIAELLNRTAFINIDFSDLHNILFDAGDAHIAVGHGKGENKVQDAVHSIVNSPLLETSIANAGKLLVNVVMSEDTLIDDLQELMTSLTSVAHKGASVKYGADWGPDLEDEIVVTVIATCFDTGELPADFITSTAATKKSGKTDDRFSGKQDDSIDTLPAGMPSLASIITKTLGEQSPDPFDDLEPLFRDGR